MDYDKKWSNYYLLLVRKYRISYDIQSLTIVQVELKE